MVNNIFHYFYSIVLSALHSHDHHQCIVIIMELMILMFCSLSFVWNINKVPFIKQYCTCQACFFLFLKHLMTWSSVAQKYLHLVVKYELVCRLPLDIIYSCTEYSHNISSSTFAVTIFRLLLFAATADSFLLVVLL